MKIRHDNASSSGFGSGLSCVALAAAARAAPSCSVPATRKRRARPPRTSGIKDLPGQHPAAGWRASQALEDKVAGLTESLSQATGANEELGHQIQQLNDKIDRMQKDFAYRLCMLSAQQLGAGDSSELRALRGTPSAPARRRPGAACRPARRCRRSAPPAMAPPAVPASAAAPPIGCGASSWPSARRAGHAADADRRRPAAARRRRRVSSAQYDQAMNLLRHGAI